MSYIVEYREDYYRPEFLRAVSNDGIHGILNCRFPKSGRKLSNGMIIPTREVFDDHNLIGTQIEVNTINYAPDTQHGGKGFYEVPINTSNVIGVYGNDQISHDISIMPKEFEYHPAYGFSPAEQANRKAGPGPTQNSATTAQAQSQTTKSSNSTQSTTGGQQTTPSQESGIFQDGMSLADIFAQLGLAENNISTLSGVILDESLFIEG